jgi:hypothetical protein
VWPQGMRRQLLEEPWAQSCEVAPGGCQYLRQSDTPFHSPAPSMQCAMPAAKPGRLQPQQ